MKYPPLDWLSGWHLKSWHGFRYWFDLFNKLIKQLHGDCMGTAALETFVIVITVITGLNKKCTLHLVVRYAKRPVKDDVTYAVLKQLRLKLSSPWFIHLSMYLLWSERKHWPITHVFDYFHQFLFIQQDIGHLNCSVIN